MTEMPLWPGLEPPEAPVPAPPGPTTTPAQQTPTRPAPGPRVGAGSAEAQPDSRGGSRPDTPGRQPSNDRPEQTGQDSDDEWIRPVSIEPAPPATPTLYQSTAPQGVGSAAPAGPRSGTPAASRAGAPTGPQGSVAAPPPRSRPDRGTVYGHAPAATPQPAQPMNPPSASSRPADAPAQPASRAPRSDRPADAPARPANPADAVVRPARPVSPAPWSDRPPGAPARPVRPAEAARSASPYGWKAPPASHEPIEVQRLGTRPVSPAPGPEPVAPRPPGTMAPRPPGPPAHRAAEHAGVYRAAATRKAGLAVAALTFAFLVPPLGIVLGHVARRRSRRGLAATALFVAYLLTLAVAAVVVLRVRGVAPFDRSV